MNKFSRWKAIEVAKYVFRNKMAKILAYLSVLINNTDTAHSDYEYNVFSIHSSIVNVAVLVKSGSRSLKISGRG